MPLSRMPANRPGALALAALLAIGLLLPACGGPTIPTGGFLDCGNVTLSTDTCDTSTAFVPPPELPDLPCPTRIEFELIRSEVPLRIARDVSAGVLACRESDGSVDLTVVENHIHQALVYLRRLRFSRPLPWTELPVYDWLRATIPFGIVLESSGLSHSCLNCPGPIHVAYTSYEHVTSTLTTLPITLFAHEARHAEGWPHTCRRNESGQFIRDKSVAEMGGFGVHYLLAYWIGHYSDQEPSVRAYYAAHAAQLLGGGSFCCECGRNSGLMARLFQRPGCRG